MTQRVTMTNLGCKYSEYTKRKRNRKKHKRYFDKQDQAEADLETYFQTNTENHILNILRETETGCKTKCNLIK